MPELFNEFEAMGDEAQDLANRVDDCLRPLYVEYAERGYRVRDIAHVIHTATGALESEIVIRQALARSSPDDG